MVLHGPSKEPKVDLFRFDHVHLGAPQKPASLSAIEAAHATEPDFERFRLRLEEYCYAPCSNSEVRTPDLRTSQPRLRSYFASSSAFRTPAPSPYSVTSEPRTPFVLRTSHLPDPMTYMSQITLMVRTYMRLVAY